MGGGTRLPEQGGRKRGGRGGEERSATVSRPALDETLHSTGLWAAPLCPPCSSRPW